MPQEFVAIPDAPGPAGPRRLWRQTVRRVFSRWGARLGLVWVLTVAFFAVFAPLLANSAPILIKLDGQWSSPMLRHLTPVDVILLVSTLAGLVLWLLKSIPLGVRAAILAGVVVLTSALAGAFVRPPDTITYEQWREAQAAGHVQFVLNTIYPYSPTDRLWDQSDPNRPHPRPPYAGHPLGTERNGADVLSRLLHACRLALAVGFVATGIACLIGVIIGGLMGYFSGIVDLLGMRLVEIFAAIPVMFLILAFVAFIGRDLYLIMAILGVTGWVGYARFVRAEFLRLRQQDFVLAAQAAGLPLWSILFKHMLPNGMAPVLVSASFSVAGAIMTEAGLSFLGLGVVDAASWGELLNQALSAGARFNWWLAIFPGLAIFLTVFAYNLIGEALRDAIDPRLQTRQA